MKTITGWDQLEDAVDRLAHVLEGLLDGPGELICSLQFDEAEALAEVLDAGLHPDVAARLMHRWALTEPDWDDEHGDVVRRWLMTDLGA
ncbi:hypothetical protein ACPW96_20150 [Micromonospora sp. DT81.3]|uniref:hypothetical protein n=1 Tax=Micromonospora sp. DT81.3 TaxID=3416523 RepID=UPI003CEC2357